MKKISTLLIVSLSFIVFSCKGDKKADFKSELELEPNEKSDEGYSLDSPDDLMPIAYIPKNQVNKPLEEGDSYNTKHLLKDDENNFKLANDNIHVVIPNSDEKMEILDVFNVSNYSDSKKLNAIVIHISNGTDEETNETVTHKLIADIKISKINGLSQDHLTDKSLKVFIINEEEIDINEKNSFKKCAQQESDYSHKECNLITSKLYEKDDKKSLAITKPREQEGDIITGG